MSKSKVMLGDMTTLEVEEFLKTNYTALLPTGSCEQHGPHLPLYTDVAIATEVAKRVAPHIGAVVAPPINYGISYEHIGLHALPISSKIFADLIEEVCVSLVNTGFKRVIVINGHWTNDAQLFYACQNAQRRITKGALVYPLSYWKALPADYPDYLGAQTGIHANVGETSAMLVINSGAVNMDKAVDSWPEMPKTEIDSLTVATQLFHVPGSFIKMTKTGAWGNSKLATRKKGEEFLNKISHYVVKLIDDVEKARKKWNV